MKLFLLSAVLLVSIRSAAADSILQFSVIYGSDFKTGSNLDPNNGYSSQTIVIGNTGTAAFHVSDLLFTASLGSTTTPVNPIIAADNVSSALILAPGQAYGYINNGFGALLTLAYVQSIFPTIDSLTIDPNNRLTMDFSNPSGSGVSFQNTQTFVNYALSIGGATAEWTMEWEMGVPNLRPGLTSGTLGHVVSNAVTCNETRPCPYAGSVPECSTLLLLGTGLLGVSLRILAKSSSG